MLGWFRRKPPKPAADEFDGIMVQLLVDGEESLFIMLGADGSINRAGTWSVDEQAGDLFIGRTDPSLFRALREQVTPELLKWCGASPSDRNPRGKLCQLTVGFERASGEQLFAVWQYGSESMAPPEVAEQFVAAVVQATDPWFTRQQAMVRGA